MTKIKASTENRNTVWTENLRPKVHTTVTHNDLSYVNLTGFNSEPGTGVDWELLSTPSTPSTQPDLNQTDDTQPDYVKGVDDLKDDIQLASVGYNGKDYSLGNCEFYINPTLAGFDQVINSVDTLLLANDFSLNGAEPYIFLRKSYHDNIVDGEIINVGENKKYRLDFIGNTGKYQLGITYQVNPTRREIYVVEVYGEDVNDNTFSAQINEDFYILKANVLKEVQVYPIPLNNSINEVSVSLVGESSNNATIINSLDEITEAGSYVINNIDQKTNAYNITDGSQVDFRDLLTYGGADRVDNNFDVLTGDFAQKQFFKVEATQVNDDKYYERKRNRLTPRGVFNAPLFGFNSEAYSAFNKEELSENGVDYERWFDIENNTNKEFTRSIIVKNNFDQFTADNIPTFNILFGKEFNENITIVRDDTKQVKLYELNSNGVPEFTTGWIDYEEAYPNNPYINAKILTEKNELIGTYFIDRKVNVLGVSNDDTIYLSKDLFLEVRKTNIALVDGYFNSSPRAFDDFSFNSKRGYLNVYKKRIEFSEAEWSFDSLELNLITSGVFASNFSFDHTIAKANIKAFTSLGVTDTNVTASVSFSGIVRLTDSSGIISQATPVSYYIVTLEFKEPNHLLGNDFNTKTTSLTNGLFHVGKGVLLRDPQVSSPEDHNDFMKGIFNATHPTHDFDFFETGQSRQGAVNIAKEVGAQIVFSASGAGSLGSDDFEPDIPHISAHFDNSDNVDDAIQNDNIDFYENAILVRGGVLGEDATTATSSFGKGVEFVQPSRRDDLDADLVARIDANLTGLQNQLGNSEHSQSPATAIFAGKFKAVLDATKAPWKIVRKAARLSADKATPNAEWNEFDGFGILNVDACIALIEQWKIDGLTRDIADTTEKRLHVPEMLDYEDLYPNTAVPKRHIEEKFSVYDEEISDLTLSNTTPFASNLSQPRLHKSGSRVSFSGMVRIPIDAVNGTVIATVSERYAPISPEFLIGFNAGSIIRITIQPNGNVSVSSLNSNNPLVLNQWVSLNSVSYLTM